MAPGCFNAAAALGVDVSQITRHFDSVSILPVQRFGRAGGVGALWFSRVHGNSQTMAENRRWRYATVRHACGCGAVCPGKTMLKD